MKLPFLLVFLVISLSALSQSNLVDSLKSLSLNKSLKETTRIDVINELAYQVRRSEPLTALAYAQDALASAKKINYGNGEGFANVIIGMYHLSNSTYERSMASALLALDIFEHTENKKGLMLSCMVLGKTYRHLKETDKALIYLNRSLKLGLELKIYEEVASVYNSLGWIARDRGDKEEALKLYEKALYYIPSENNPVRVYVLGNIGGLYLQSSETEKALPYFKEALSVTERIKDKNCAAFMHLQLGLLYKQRKEIARAEEHFKKCEVLAVQTGDKKYLLDVYVPIIELKTMQGKSHEANEYQVRYNEVRDSIFNMDKARQIAALTTLHETEKKQQTIRLLEQEKKMQTLWRNVLTGGVLFLLVASLLVFVLQRSRTRKAKQLLVIQHLLNDKLKEVDKFKSHLFATISHELRTPLTLILAPLEEELKDRQQEKEKGRLLLMRRSANRLLELVNQLLDLSKLESGKMELRARQGSVESFLKVITASFDSWAQHKKIHFAKNFYLNEKTLWFDQDKLEKIITNLLANAIKFTPANGTVTFMVACQEKSSAHILSIIVSDTGIGIPEDEQEQVFNPFYRTRESEEIHPGGTGLGLSLVKELVKLYGGVITLKSKTGSGSTFSVELPCEKNAFSAWQIDERFADTPVMNSVSLIEKDRFAS